MFKFHGDFEFSASFLDGTTGRMQPRGIEIDFGVFRESI